MHRSIPVTTAALLLLLPVTGRAQGRGPELEAPKQLRDALDLETATVQEIFLLPGRAEELMVPVTFGGSSHVLRLRARDVRSDGFRLLVDDGGGELREVPPSPSVTYRGDLVGEPGSVVAATVIDGRIRADMRTAGRLWSIQPVSDAGPGLPSTAHVVYERADVRQFPIGCATVVPDHLAAAASEPPEAAAAVGLKIAELAIDADEPFYRTRNRSVTAVENDITGIINAGNVIYTRDLGIEHEITTIIVRTRRTYTANGDLLLFQFQSLWNSQHNDVPRDVAHLFTGRGASQTLGIAFVGSLCDLDAAYGVSWSDFSSNQTLRVALTAHELGHGWGAGHCDEINDCRIMCSGLGGCSGDVTRFSPVSVSAIAAFRNSVSCLSDPVPDGPPSITSILPATVTSFGPDDVTVTGAELSQVSSVEVAGVPAGFTIVTDDTLVFTPPAPFAIDTHQVTVTNAVGSDSANLTVVGNHPSVMVVPLLVFRGVPFTARLHTDREWQGIFVLSTSTEPSILEGIVTLDIGNNFTNIVTLNVFADTRGVAEATVTFPLTLPAPFVTYWQAIAFDPENIVFPVENSAWLTIIAL